MSIIYPPAIDGKLPAQTGGTIRVKFQPSSLVNTTTQLAARIMTVSTNTIIATFTGLIPENNMISFSTPLGVTNGNYYKIQLAYYDVNDTGLLYYSNVGVFKYYTNTISYTANNNTFKFTLPAGEFITSYHFDYYIGDKYQFSSKEEFVKVNQTEIIFNGTSELMKTGKRDTYIIYCIYTTNNGITPESSGIKPYITYSNGNWTEAPMGSIQSSDKNFISIPLNSQSGNFIRVKDGKEYEILDLQISEKNQYNDYNIESGSIYSYGIYQNGSQEITYIANSDGVELDYEIMPSHHIIGIHDSLDPGDLGWSGSADNRAIKALVEPHKTYIISGSAGYRQAFWAFYSSDDILDPNHVGNIKASNLLVELGEIRMTGGIANINNAQVVAPEGAKYIVIAYHPDYIKAKIIEGNKTAFVAEYEDMYLSDNEVQLCIRFNPKVSSFKETVLESKVDTIGSQYPFFFRNSNVKYKEFPISGLISYNMDDDQTFFHLSSAQESIRPSTPHTTNQEKIFIKGTQLTSENIAYERQFKMKVLEWLNNGKPKVFRSPTEGNFIVRLMNVTLQPEDQLGRMIHSFSATAYEIDEYTIDNIKKHNCLFGGYIS